MPRILVIDDDHSTRVALDALLTRKQFDVFLAPDGPSGLRLISTLSFDAVIIDMFMPGMDGIATIRQLIKLKPNLPFIAISGCAFTDRKQGAPDFLGMAIRLGAAASLQKPFPTSEFLEVIDRALHIGLLRLAEMRLRDTRPVAIGQAS
jgi:two-component system, response regulator, stage 0 sporulation protein F